MRKILQRICVIHRMCLKRNYIAQNGLNSPSFCNVKPAKAFNDTWCVQNNMCQIVRNKSTISDSATRQTNEPVCQRSPLDSRLVDASSEEALADVSEGFSLCEDFISEEEEHSLFEEVEPYMKRLRYEKDHWDNAILGYRETERKQWKRHNQVVIQRVRELAFPPDTPQLAYVHVLDLAEDGIIKAHVDSVRFCGNTIAGLSLLSDSVMRLVHEKDPSKFVDLLVKRRSLYIMSGKSRYDYTHEILGGDASVFRGSPVKKTRRLSVICRNEAPDDQEK